MNRTGFEPTADDPLSNCSEPRWLPIESLLPADSPRQAGEDLDHARMLAGLDAHLPAIVVHRSSMRVIDGMHRLHAARLRGDEKVEVRFFTGTEQEAFVLAVRLNVAHGLPLSYDDRTRAAERVIGSHPGWSNRAIAAVVGLGAQTVGNIRRRVLRHLDGDPCPARVGRDGRVRPLNGADGRLRAADLIRERPDASLREIAREAGVSPSTVSNVRLRLERSDDPLPEAQRREETPADPADNHPADNHPADNHPADLVTLLHRLQNDPALRFSESGRSLLRWILSRSVRPGDWTELADKVPPHSTYLIANLARACAAEWRQLAEELEARGGPDQAS